MIFTDKNRIWRAGGGRGGGRGGRSTLWYAQMSQRREQTGRTRARVSVLQFGANIGWRKVWGGGGGGGEGIVMYKHISTPYILHRGRRMPLSFSSSHIATSSHIKLPPPPQKKIYLENKNLIHCFGPAQADGDEGKNDFFLFFWNNNNNKKKVLTTWNDCLMNNKNKTKQKHLVCDIIPKNKGSKRWEFPLLVAPLDAEESDFFIQNKNQKNQNKGLFMQVEYCWRVMKTTKKGVKRWLLFLSFSKRFSF